jgi:phospholipid/cholesterol/gamma-HCH transport system substrate-binding protein
MMNLDERPSRHDFALGATAIGAMVGIAALLLAFGKLQPLLERRFPVIVETNGAQGVRPGSLVTLNGVTVGAVRGVEVDPAWNPPVQITIELRPDARVPADAEIRLAESLVGGSAEVAFRVRSDTSAGATLLSAAQPPMRVRGESVSLQERLDGALVGAKAAIDRARVWLDDEQLRADVKGAVGRANLLFDEATDTVQIVGNLSQSVQMDATKLAVTLQRTADSLASAMARVDEIVARVAKGEGTAGRMVNDPSLYENLADSGVRLREALDQANLLLLQIREKGLQIKVP